VQILHNAARQGARAAVRLDNSNAEVEAAVLNSLQKSIDVDPSAVTVRLSKLNELGNENYQIQNLNENEQGQAVRVTVIVNSAHLGLPSNFLGLSTTNLSSSAVMERRN
jgi:CRISPR/Cas system-associated exonuclease Cas4 (RecB family)